MDDQRHFFQSCINFSHQAWICSTCSRNSSHLNDELLSLLLQIGMSLPSERTGPLPSNWAFDPHFYHLLQAFIHHLSHLFSILNFLISPASSLQSTNILKPLLPKKNFSLYLLSSWVTALFDTTPLLQQTFWKRTWTLCIIPSPFLSPSSSWCGLHFPIENPLERSFLISQLRNWLTDFSSPTRPRKPQVPFPKLSYIMC